ncbi:hypothetical protein LINGRAPRIM_LOCUS480, partial [Linum grandiflorum]
PILLRLPSTQSPFSDHPRRRDPLRRRRNSPATSPSLSLTDFASILPFLSGFEKTLS